MCAVQIQKLPPGPERPELHFQPRLAGRVQYPVSAEFHGGDDWDSPGIAFDDYRSMQTVQHKLASGDRLETPEWATNDALLRKVLIAYLESRAGFRTAQPGTEKERMQRANETLAATRPVRVRVLSNMCKQYVALKHQNADQRELNKLAQEIETLDTVLRTEAHIAAVVVGIVHAFYRRGLNSVEVGFELGIKPPHVRQTLWRLRRCWDRLQGLAVRPANPERKGKPRWKRRRVSQGIIDVARALRMYDSGMTFVEIGKAMGRHPVSVWYALKRSAHYKPRPKGPRKTTTAEPERMVKLYAEGKSIAQVAKKFQTSPMSVCRALKKQDYTPRPFRKYRHGAYCSPSTLAKHVAIMETLAAANGGTLPLYTWLNAHGYFRSYEVMRHNPQAFAHIARA